MPPSVTQRILTGVAVGIVIGVLIAGQGHTSASPSRYAGH